MSGSLKWFEYTTDADDAFAIFMDESNGESVGNADYTTSSTATMKLPKNVEARYAVYRSTDGAYTRKIPVSSNTATVATLPATISAQIAGSATGQDLSLVSFVGERMTLLPRADDTGLNDGDAT